MYSTPQQRKDEITTLQVAKAINLLELKFGKRPTDRTLFHKNAISTGSLGLDLALGGGYREGIHTVFGDPGAGKTTLALSAIAKAQSNGKTCAFIDAEHALDPHYAELLNVDTRGLATISPTTGEQALESVYLLAASGAVDFIVVDSVAALAPKMELEAEMGDESVLNVLSRLLSRALIPLSQVAASNHVTILFLNQTRMRFDSAGKAYRSTPGGQAIKHYSKIRVDLRVVEQDRAEDGELSSSIKSRAIIVQDKEGNSTGQNITFTINHSQGVDKPKELAELGKVFGLITQDESGFSFYKGEALGKTMVAIKRTLQDSPAIAGRLWKDVRIAKSSGTTATAPESAATSAINKMAALFGG